MNGDDACEEARCDVPTVYSTVAQRRKKTVRGMYMPDKNAVLILL